MDQILTITKSGTVPHAWQRTKYFSIPLMAMYLSGQYTRQCDQHPEELYEKF